MATSSLKRSRASSISPRSTSARISTASRESSETGVAMGRRGGVETLSPALPRGPRPETVRDSPLIEALRWDRDGVYSLLHLCRLLTRPDRREYDPAILRMLLGLRILGVFNEHRG